MKSNRVIAVVGPTASGKTKTAVDLALELGGEVISCDSMQLYKYMDIGTAKPTAEEMRGVRHHMIDIALPEVDFSCADYAKMASETAHDILKRGKTPIFCGGTGLYLDSALGKNSFSPDISPEIRKDLEKLSPDELYDRLMQVDPESAENIHKNNVKRVTRALEIYIGTGVTKTEWDKRSKLSKPEFDAVFVGLDFHSRDILYDRINKRVDIMLDDGLVEEVKKLDLKRDSNAAQAIGYKEIYMYLDGKLNYDEAVELLKKNTRNYAKRQLTWFRRNGEVRWFYQDSEDGKFEHIVNYLKDF